MKKLAIGCGIVLLLIGIVVAGAGYYAYRQASSMFAQLRELDRVPEIERSVRVKTTYVPPATGELTASQVERLVKVQALVRQRLGQRFSELETKYKALIDKKDATIVDVPALLGAYRDMAAAWMEAKRSQVDGLNAVDMSLEEYKWIREQTLPRARRALHGSRRREDRRADPQRSGQPGGGPDPRFGRPGRSREQPQDHRAVQEAARGQPAARVVWPLKRNDPSSFAAS